MSQYRVGTVSVVSGSPYVSGAGTLFDSVGISVGSLFNLEGSSGWYYIASVPSNSGLTLTTGYTGSTQYNQNYVIVRDYLSPQNIPLMHKGDINWTSIFNEAMLRIKTSLDNVSSGASSPSGSGLGLDGAYDVDNTIAVDSDPVIFYRSGYYGSSQNANAFRIVDQTTEGPSGNPPMEGALQYIYSKHRIPIIAVHNEANRSQPTSPTESPHAAIIGMAYSDEHSRFEDLSPLKNVGVAGYSIDYHDSYAVDYYSNIGVWAYSQRGYGLAAYSGSSYSIYTYQTVSHSGIYAAARQPLLVTNQPFGDASNSFAIQVQARKAGIDIQSSEAGTAGYPLLKVNTSGRAIESAGQSVLTHTSTALEVSGGGVSVPLANLNAPNGVGLQVYSGASYGITASSSGKPSIKATHGIITYSDDKDTIVSPEKGTVVYSDADSDLMLYNGSEWVNVAASGGAGSIPTMQQVYNTGRTIAITTGSTSPLSISSADELALSVTNTNLSEARNALDTYSARGWGVSISSDATDTTAGGMYISSDYGTCIRALSRGPLVSYTTPGVAGGYGMTMSLGTGGGIQIMSANEDDVTRGPLNMQTTSATGITMVTTSGKLINYTANTGALVGDRYAITASHGTGGGMHLYGTGATKANLRLENTNTLSTLLEIEAGGGTAIDITNAQRAITASCQGDYALFARSDDYPSVKSYNGIVAYSYSYTSVNNPEPGTITFSWWDKMLYYYIDDTNGWMPVAIPSGYTAPSGTASCLCIDGVIVYTSDKYLITSGAKAEGQLVFDHATQKVFVVDQNLDWLEVGGSASGGDCTCPDGVNIYHYDKEDITSPAEGTLLYEGETQTVYYWNGAEWTEVGEGAGGTINYSRGYNNRYSGSATIMNDVASFIVPYNGILTGIKFAVDNAPGTDGIEFDVRRKETEGTSGSSILGGVPITIDNGNYESTPRALSQVVNQFDTIVFDITDVDGSTPGGDDIRVLYYIESDFSGAKGVTLLVTGDITAGDSIANAASFIVPYDGTITEVKAAVDTAPAGGAMTFDINKKQAGGSSWASIMPSTLQIADGAYESTVVTVNAAVNQYDHINLDIDSTGSLTAGGSDVRVLISLTESETDSYTIVNVSTNYTVGATDRLISINSGDGDIVITMPDPANVGGTPFILKKNSSDTNTITVNGTDIDGTSSITMIAPWQSVTLVSNGTRYNRV